MIRRIYLATEGVHDVAFIGRLLTQHFGFNRVRDRDSLDDGWKQWVNKFKWPFVAGNKQHSKFPIDRGSVPVPAFFARPTSHTFVAVVNAMGITELLKMIEQHTEAFRLDQVTLDAIGVLLDADAETPSARKKRMETGLLALKNGADGPISAATQTHVFVLPDDVSSGTLEDLLLALGKQVYPVFMSRAEQYVQGCREELFHLDPKEREDISKPAGAKKAQLAAVGAILKPGKPIQATLEDHRWVSEATLPLPVLAPCIQFLTRLIEHDPGDVGGAALEQVP